MANPTEQVNPKRVQITISVVVPNVSEAVAVMEWADGLKAKYPGAVVETRFTDNGRPGIGIP